MSNNWSRLRLIAAVVAVTILPAVCGLVFLANHAPRDWSLHWLTPSTVIAATSEQRFAATATPRGWDVLWVSPSGTLTLSRFDRTGRRLGGDVQLRGSPQTLTLGYSGGTDVAAWREDYNGGSRLVAAIVAGSGAPKYRVLANGSWPLEHPYAFSAGATVDIVYSWQRPVFNVYLSRVAPSGLTRAPVALTHAQSYAFNPHALLDDRGNIRLIYLDECCGLQAFHVEAATYSPNGRLLGPPVRLDTLNEIVRASANTVPNDWGTDIARQGHEIWAAWANDTGVAAAEWVDGALRFHGPVAFGPGPLSLALVLGPGHRELVWQQMATPNPLLSTVELSPTGVPTAAPDRVAFEPATDDVPIAVGVSNGTPQLMWQAAYGTNSTRIELSRYSPATIGAPNFWTRLGLGLANPVGDAFLLLFGGLAIGFIIAVGNLLVGLALLALYLLVLRRIPPPWKWYAYAAGLAIALYVLLVDMGAPFPPVLAFSAFSSSLGLLAVAAMAGFVLITSLTWLRRMDDSYRAAVMVFLGLYFLGFLQALTIVQDIVAKV